MNSDKKNPWTRRREFNLIAGSSLFTFIDVHIVFHYEPLELHFMVELLSHDLWEFSHAKANWFRNSKKQRFIWCSCVLFLALIEWDLHWRFYWFHKINLHLIHNQFCFLFVVKFSISSKWIMANGEAKRYAKYSLTRSDVRQGSYGCSYDILSSFRRNRQF